MVCLQGLKEPGMEADKIEIKPFFISLAVIFFSESAANVLISNSLFPSIVTLGGIRLLEIILLIVIIMIFGKGLSSIGLAGYQMLPGFKKGLTLSVSFGIAASFAFGILYIAGINPMTFIRTCLPEQPQELLFFFILGGLIAPIAEEIFFRGVLYGFLRRWGVRVAILFSTLIFVLAHPIGSGIPLTQTIGGIVLAFAYENGGKLMVPITIHVLANMAIFTLSLLL